LQLSVGSRWIDTQSRVFVVDAVDNNGVETWVSYYREGTDMHYRTLVEAFTYRFREIIQ
jgi:hypothetical protein